jgi:hypothetical protein
MRNFYTVTMKQTDGLELTSRIFDTIRAARVWKKYLSGCVYVVKTSIRIMKGGQGGIEIV